MTELLGKEMAIYYNLAPCWIVPPNVRDVLAHARSLGLRVNVYRGAGWKARRCIHISGAVEVMQLLQKFHDWLKATPENTLNGGTK